jgi:septum formation protein
MTTRLVLASSSPYRRELLQRLRLPFICDSPHIDETPLPGEDVISLTRRLALAKARAVAARHPGALIIGSDQACVRDDNPAPIGKPGDFATALQQLQACSGRRVSFHTALVLLDSTTGLHQSADDVFAVVFRNLREREIRRYLELEEPYDCAGSFKAEALGITLFAAMEGRDFHSLIGLPLISLCDLLRQAGMDPLQPASNASVV